MAQAARYFERRTGFHDAFSASTGSEEEDKAPNHDAPRFSIRNSSPGRLASGFVAPDAMSHQQRSSDECRDEWVYVILGQLFFALYGAKNRWHADPAGGSWAARFKHDISRAAGKA